VNKKITNTNIIDFILKPADLKKKEVNEVMKNLNIDWKTSRDRTINNPYLKIVADELGIEYENYTSTNYTSTNYPKPNRNQMNYFTNGRNGKKGMANKAINLYKYYTNVKKEMKEMYNNITSEKKIEINSLPNIFKGSYYPNNSRKNTLLSIENGESYKPNQSFSNDPETSSLHSW
jgi:hypothetical protein